MHPTCASSHINLSFSLQLTPLSHLSLKLLFLMFSSTSHHDHHHHHHQMYPHYNLSRPMSVAVDGRWKPTVEIAPNCPRCDSSNTKFCYYNNYSLTQPRYFCKGCRRYWTKGGSLRNVPVGGGCRKNRRSKSLRPQPMTATSTSRTSSTTPPGGGGGLRPDLALDDMVGGGSCRSTICSDNMDGSNIDLAMLYSKFLNNQGGGSCSNFSCSDQGLAAHGEAGDRPLDSVGTSLGSDQIGLISGEYFEYGFDPNGYESNLGLDPLVNLGPPEQLQQGFCAVDHSIITSHHHHQDMFVGDWCASLDHSSFGAF